MFADNGEIRPIVACRMVNTALGFSRVVYALFDQGSDRDVISHSLVRDLRLDMWTQYITVKTVDNSVEGERALTGNDVPPAKRCLSA